MKRLGVAAFVKGEGKMLMGRRGKDPNRGLYVLPGGGVEDGESLEDALHREILEETGIEIQPDEQGYRWEYTLCLDLPDRVILVVTAIAKPGQTIVSGSDLYDVGWFDYFHLPPLKEISPVIHPILEMFCLFSENKE